MNEDNPYPICQICGASGEQVDIFIFQIAMMTRFGDLQGHEGRRIQLCPRCKRRLWAILEQTIGAYIYAYEEVEKVI